ncbi:MAG: hypothetical protein ABR586_00195, partial [Thermoplasmatota archaeon]
LNDTAGRDSTVYKLSFFVGQSEQEGFFSDASHLERMAGWNEDVGVQPQAPPATPPHLATASQVGLPARIALTALGVTLLCCLVAVVVAGTRKPSA